MWRSCWPLLTGATAGGGIASLVATLGKPAGQAPLFLLAAVAGGGVVAIAAARVLGGDRLCPMGDELKTLPELEVVYRQGYEIGFRGARPAKTFRKWTFTARLRGQVVGRLDADFIEGKKWLYIENVHVDHRHGNRGLGTALLLCAAMTTDCKVLTTSSRTRRGVRFFANNEPMLKNYGITLRDNPP